MSDGELRPGTAIFLRAFKDHPNENVQLNFPAPKEKGRYHLAIWLGTWKDGDGTTVGARMNHLGWVYDPEKARELCATRSTQGDQP